jgi:hypothetical protein
MVQIKGSAIKETIEQIKKRAGEDAFQKILGLLDEETRKVCGGEIFASSWYSLDFFTRFLEIEIRVLANGNEEMVTRGSEAIIERQLRGIYKAFVKLGSPESPPFTPRIFREFRSTYSCRGKARRRSGTRDFKNSIASWASRSSDFSRRRWRFPERKT